LRADPSAEIDPPFFNLRVGTVRRG